MARYVSGGLASGTFDGKVYTLPYQGNSMSLFLNNKLFAAAGLDADEGRAQDLEGPDGALPQAEEGAGQADGPEGLRLPVSQPALGNAGCSSRWSSSSAARS